jgi:putative membrane protein
MPLHEEERSRVRAAITRAEEETSGEIFVVVARESGAYRFVPLFWAMAAALLVPLPLIVFTLLPAATIFAVQLAVFILLSLLLSLPGLWHRITPGFIKDRVCRALAVQQFLAHGIHMTERRTGVLILVSLAEHRAEIVADTGISTAVSQPVWDEAMAVLLSDIRAGRLADGLVAAVERTGAVLAVHFPRAADDRDEIPDDIILL